MESTLFYVVLKMNSIQGYTRKWVSFLQKSWRLIKCSQANSNELCQLIWSIPNSTEAEEFEQVIPHSCHHIPRYRTNPFNPCWYFDSTYQIARHPVDWAENLRQDRLTSASAPRNGNGTVPEKKKKKKTHNNTLPARLAPRSKVKILPDNLSFLPVVFPSKPHQVQTHTWTPGWLWGGWPPHYNTEGLNTTPTERWHRQKKLL